MDLMFGKWHLDHWATAIKTGSYLQSLHSADQLAAD